MLGGILSQIQRMMFKTTSPSFDGDVNSVEAIGDNLLAVKQKTTGPAYDADTDSNEAISMALAVVDGLVDGMVARMPTAGVIQTAYFRKGVQAVLVFPIFDKDGDLVSSAAGLDSEVSKDGAGFNDCTNEAAEIANGVYALTLTATEMNADIVAVVVKTSTTDAKNTCTVIYTSGPGA